MVSIAVMLPTVGATAAPTASPLLPTSTLSGPARGEMRAARHLSIAGVSRSVSPLVAAFTIYLAAKVQGAAPGEVMLILVCTLPQAVMYFAVLLIVACPSDTGLHLGLASTARFYSAVSITSCVMAGWFRMQLPQAKLALLVDYEKRTTHMTPFVMIVLLPFFAAFDYRVTEPLTVTARTAARAVLSVALPMAFMGTLWARTGDSFFLHRFASAWLAMLAGFCAMSLAALAARSRRGDGSPLQDQLDLALQVAKTRSRNITFFVLLAAAHALPLVCIAASLGLTHQAMALICIGAAALVDATVQRGPWAAPGARPWLGPKERRNM